MSGTHEWFGLPPEVRRPDEPMRQVLIRMKPEMVEALKANAAANDRSVSATVRRAVREYLDD